jgi:ABC-type tungstate transport system substrate-binding protein
MFKAFQDAISLLSQLDPTVLGVVLTSITVSGIALILGSLVGLPLGAVRRKFEARRGARAVDEGFFHGLVNHN